MSHVLDDAAPVRCLARPELAGSIRASRPDLPIVEVERDVDLLAQVEPADVELLPAPDDVSCVIYTSGTTGPAKGVVIRWAQLAATVGRLPLVESDVSYACFPMFHVTGRTPMITMADVGGRVVFRERFSLSVVLDDVLRYGCTTGTFIAGLLLSLPPDAKTTYPFRLVFTGHSTELNEQFGDRFGVRGYDCYGSTEAGFPIVRTEAPPDRERMWCGRVRPGYEARFVDQKGNPVDDGVPGELWLRAGDRRMLMSRYLNSPEATANAFDGDWYKTGDIMIRHDDGNIEFLDRAKDTIRRMGENISAKAVEVVLEVHPDVAAAAVLGVPDRVAGHEVLMLLEPKDGRTIDAPEFYAWLRDRVSKHALPRYLLVTALPRTPTQKVRKKGLLDIVDLTSAWSPPNAR